MTDKLRKKDIDEILRLFQQLEKLLNPDLLDKNKELWEQCQDEAKKNLVQELKKQESKLTSRTGRIASKSEQKKSQDNCEKIILQRAEKMYCEKDSTYFKVVDAARNSLEEIIKKIDHTLYAIREPLLIFDRAQGTLLQEDWQKIRDFLQVIDITHPNFKFYIQESIDALEAIKCKIEYQQQVEPTEKPAEIEQKVTLRRRIWISVKRIPHWIYVLIIFLAALLTIIHYMEWI